VLAAAATGEGYWIKERKDEFGAVDPWLRRAIVATSRMLPGDEGKFWRKKIKGNLSDAEKLVALWVYQGDGRVVQRAGKAGRP
jgi:hypothetical protein